MNKNHVLVIGGHSKAHQYLLGKNDTIVSWIYDIDSPKDRKGYFRSLGLDLKSNTEEIYEWVELLNKICKIDYLFNFSEEDQEKTAVIAEKLSIKYHSLKTINAVNDKYLMRKALKISGVPGPHYEKIESHKDLKKFFNASKGDIILKPLNGVGSKNIFRLTSEDEVESMKSYLDKSDSGTLYIAEDYIRGKEYSVEAITKGDYTKIIAVTEKHKGLNYVESGHVIPAQINEALFFKIEEYLKKIFRVLNIESGITHTEIKIYNSEISVIETHLRCGGDGIVNLVENALGLNMYEVWIDSILYEIPLDDLVETKKTLRKYSGVFYKHNKKNGIVVNIQKPSCQKELVNIGIMKPVGSLVCETKCSKDRLAYVELTRNDYESVLNMGRDLVEKIEFEID